MGIHYALAQGDFHAHVASTWLDAHYRATHWLGGAGARELHQQAVSTIDLMAGCEGQSLKFQLQ